MATFKHYVPTMERQKHHAKNPKKQTATGCDRLARWYFASSLTDDPKKVTCKKCLKALEKISTLETSHIHIRRGEDGLVYINSQNVTHDEIVNAIVLFTIREKTKK